MKNKKLILILKIGLPITAFILILATVISIVSAWYTNVNQTGEIDAHTKNVGFTYKINDSSLENDYYNISNLAFFDINSKIEGPYFKVMAVEAMLEVSNITDNDINYTISYEATRRYVENKTISYVGCIITDTKLGYAITNDLTFKENKDYYTYDELTHKYTKETVTVGSSVTANKYYDYNPSYLTDEDKVEDLYVDSSNTKYTINSGTNESFKVVYDGGSLKSKGSAGDSQVMYLYLFGVQEIDSAKNDDFIYERHNFRLIIEGSSNTNWTVTDNEEE